MRHVVSLADYIISPLGHGTAANWDAVAQGKTALRSYNRLWDMPFPVVAALIDDEAGEASDLSSPHTRFERLCIAAARGCLSQTDVNPSSSRFGIILSTTKADVATLAGGTCTLPSQTLLHIAEALGITTRPIVVSNACISGGHAQITAMRLLQRGDYDHILVIGADELSPFIVSGFQSLRSLSPEPCRPFDMDRLGLNLGEGFAAMLLAATDSLHPGEWVLRSGAVRNDAVHISNPSKTAEGAWRAISACMEQAARHGDEASATLACISAHGTATMYNDEMESIAIRRTALLDVPVVGLKGYYGHTMGAAGLIETIITMQSLEHHAILPTLGYAERGTSGALRVLTAAQPTTGDAFLKLLSGFGGGNVALLWQRVAGRETAEAHSLPRPTAPATIPSVHLRCTASELLTHYRAQAMDYPKFHKMDLLSKTGILAAEQIRAVADGAIADAEWAEHTAIILCGHTGSLAADAAFQATISDAADYFPSPSLFVYTLPNIVTGEIALRHLMHGETAFYLLPERDAAQIAHLLTLPLHDSAIHHVLGGWIDADGDICEATMLLINSENTNLEIIETLQKTWNS